MAAADRRPIARRNALIAAGLAAWLAWAGEAAACVFRAEPRPDSAAEALSIAALPAGITKGWVDCGNAAHPLVVWTLEIDPEQPSVGVRDGPLFRDVPANPLVPVIGARVGDGARLTVFQRRETAPWPAPVAPDRRPPFRMFGTICDAAAATPLDCWAGIIRVKARVNAEDRDHDGVLDNNRHQLSIFHAGRLQVLTFNRPHAATPLGVAGHWIEALQVAGLM